MTDPVHTAVLVRDRHRRTRNRQVANVDDRADGSDSERESYRVLQQAVGLLGLVFPVGLLAVGHQLHSSLSQYYFTNARNLFVGTLCSMGLVLICYRGINGARDRGDRRWSNTAGCCAIALAFVPTLQDGTRESSTVSQWVMAVAHALAGLTLFVSMAVLVARYFVKTNGTPTSQKLRRNRVYCACAIAIVVGIVGMVPAYFVHGPSGHVLFIVSESLATFAFAAAWLIKGGFCGLLADPTAPPL